MWDFMAGEKSRVALAEVGEELRGGWLRMQFARTVASSIANAAPGERC